MITIEQGVGISLELGCDNDGCKDFAGPLYVQLSHGYDICSVMPLPASVGQWRDAHRTARKRAARAQRLGYVFAEIQRENFGDDIYRINTSLDKRQGRPMSQSYRRPVDLAPLPDYPCVRHAVRTYGVLSAEQLVAYLWLYRAGDLALVSSILGHGDHLRNDVMYLLVQGVIDRESAYGGCLVYNRWDSGTDGLRYFKERLGFKETTVEWLP